MENYNKGTETITNQISLQNFTKATEQTLTKKRYILDIGSTENE